MGEESKEKRDLKEINKPILKGLEDLKILEGRVEYRVAGSLIPTALEGKFYRQVSDIDVLTQSDKFNFIRKLLEDKGYTGEVVEPPHRLGFKWLELHKGQTKMALIFGEFDDKGGWRMPLKYGFSLYLPPSTLQPTTYEIEGVSFPGVVPEIAYLSLKYGAMLANPKRERDLKPFEGKVNQEKVAKIKGERPGIWLHNRPLPTEEIVGFIVAIGEKFLG